MNAILVICLNPTFQRTMVFDTFLEGEVNRCTHYRLDASGKGVNVARVIAELGGEAIHLTHHGGPRTREMLDMLAEDGIEPLWTDSESPIRTCTTIINSSRGTTTELVEEPAPVALQTDGKIRELFTQALGRVSTVVISGTRTAGYSPNLYPDFVREAKAAGKRVILDVKGHDLERSLPFGVDVVKPNLSEFVATFMPGTRVLEQQDSHEIKDEVIKRLGQLYDAYGTSFVLTRGAFSVWVYGDPGFFELPVEQVRAVNTIGCGDAVTAGMAHELHRGTPLAQAIDKGLACGKANAMTLRPGTILGE